VNVSSVGHEGGAIVLACGPAGCRNRQFLPEAYDSKYKLGSYLVQMEYDPWYLAVMRSLAAGTAASAGELKPQAAAMRAGRGERWVP
jgi:hypothetical protein